MYQRWVFIIMALLVISCATPYRPVVTDDSYTDPQFGISFSLPAAWTVMDQHPDWVQQHLNRIYIKPKLVLVSKNEKCCIIYTTGKLNVSTEDVNKYPDKLQNEIAVSLRRSIEKHKEDLNLIDYDYDVYPIKLERGRLTAICKLEETAEFNNERMTWTIDSYLSPSVRKIKFINFIYLSKDINAGSLKNDFEVLKASATVAP
jgi:hypothetical protein